MTRDLKNIGLVLLCLVVLLILVNVFYVVPLVSFRPARVSYLQEQPFDLGESGTGEELAAVDTLSIIKESGTDVSVVPGSSGGEDTRNPFFWPEEKTVKQQEAVKQQVSRKKPLLNMVIVGEGRSQALLDNVFVREGEKFHGYLVKKIAGNKVVLSDKFGDFTIYLASGDGPGGQEQLPAGIIER